MHTAPLGYRFPVSCMWTYIQIMPPFNFLASRTIGTSGCRFVRWSQSEAGWDPCGRADGDLVEMSSAVSGLCAVGN